MDGYVVTTGDFHGSEYVGSFFKTRAWLSGFTGLGGNARRAAGARRALDGRRYFLQAGQQLAGSTIELMREGQPGVPRPSPIFSPSTCRAAARSALTGAP